MSLASVRDEMDVRSTAKGTVVRMAKRFGATPDGASSTYPIIVVAGAEPGPTVCLVAGIHGDEYEGPAALWRVVAQLDPLAIRGRVVIVPVAHGAAFAAGTRTSPIDGVNLARIFPGNPNGTMTERLAHDLFESIVRPADALVDLHSGGVRTAFVQVAGFYGPGAGVSDSVSARSLDLAKAMGLPWIWQMPPRPGVMSFEAAKAGVAVTGCEAGGRGGCLEQDVDAYVLGVTAILSQSGVMAPPPNLATGRRFATYLDGDFALAPAGGFLEPMVPLGQRVETGALLAVIRGPFGEELARLVADIDGVVMAERHLRAIHAGEWATCCVRERPL